ncbi:hypothetical protein HA466_0128840 [Hirschfeldia incana]|nr:hypothetical protein HA466_0128840 [Hirschfeldia incana]KAJ0252019.1 hypothetical protein HA466_0128840 [Hirschfeldia incana]
MLHFLQMPIEDAFLDQIDHKDPITKDTTDVVAVSIDETPVLKDAPEEKEKETENANPVTAKDALEKEDENEGKVPQEESSKPADASEETNEVEADQKTPEVEVETVIDESCKDEADENIALKALTEAFEDVGYPITPEAFLSFADLGNPVMGLVSCDVNHKICCNGDSVGEVFYKNAMIEYNETYFADNNKMVTI